MNLTNIGSLLSSVDNFFYTYLLTTLLILVGIYLTTHNRLVQLRHFDTMVNLLPGSRSGTRGGISSFQAFAVGLIVRVGIGNIVGIALTTVAGGPGALFWMWVVVFIGMAASFVGFTLAQIFKERDRDFTFRGGPAYRIRSGLRSTLWGKTFITICIASIGVMVIMVQANSLAQVISATVPGVSGWMVGVLLVPLTAPVVLGGVRLVARVAEWLAPITALAYVFMAMVIIVLNIDRLPEILGGVLEGAFGPNQALFGITGGIFTALLNSVRHGLLSDEAGLGTVPNTAGTATVIHLVRQGLIQSFGVFIDTILTCTATGLLILLTAKIYHPGDDSLVEAIFTQQAVAEHLDAWTTWSVVVLISVLIFSTVLGCHSYTQVNVNFLGGERQSEQIFGILPIATASSGIALTLPVVWALSDIILGPPGVLNLVAIIRLVPQVVGTLRDFESQHAWGITEPAFVGHSNSLLPDDVVPGIWEPNDMVKWD